MRQALWFSFLLCVACYICAPIIDTDLWWHIVVGRWILAHHAVPHVDYWTTFGSGLPWRAYSWSNEIVYALADRYFGASGLVLLKLALSILIVFSFGFTFKLLAADWFFGAVLAALAAAGCVSHLTLRPQSFVWVLFVWVLYVGHRVREENLSGKRAVQIILIFALWANSHVTAILGLSALFCFSYSPQNLKRALLAVFIGLIGTLITPYAGGEWLALASQVQHPLSMTSVLEFGPATILETPTALFLMAILLLVLFSASRGARNNVPGIRILGLGAFALVGLAIIKFLPFVTFYALALVALEWPKVKVIEPKNNLVLGFERLRTFAADKVAGNGAVFLLVCLSILSVHNLLEDPINKKITPVAAVDFIERNNIPRPLLNDFGAGGYLTYRFSDRSGTPRYLVPIDGRTNLISPELWKAHEAALFAQGNWRDLFNLTKAKSVLWRNQTPLPAVLEASGEWTRVYRDGDQKAGFSIFVRKTGNSAS